MNAGWLASQGKIPKGMTSVPVDRLGNLEVKGSEIVLGTLLIINAANIDPLNF
jgi:hypothetical protein